MAESPKPNQDQVRHTTATDDEVLLAAMLNNHVIISGDQKTADEAKFALALLIANEPTLLGKTPESVGYQMPIIRQGNPDESVDLSKRKQIKDHTGKSY